MTHAEKQVSFELRLGLGYKAIARELLLTVDIVKGYCKRLNGSIGENGFCSQCKNPIQQKERGRTKKFCSNACRHTWWNEIRINAARMIRQSISTFALIVARYASLTAISNRSIAAMTVTLKQGSGKEKTGMKEQYTAAKFSEQDFPVYGRSIQRKKTL